LEQDAGLHDAITDMLREKLGERMADFAIPPPVSITLGSQFVGLDLDAGSLTARFPIREGYLNPYGTMQGGMIAAAVDNTVGPLSVLIAPPNVTRQLEITYSRPVTRDLGHILVTAQFLERQDRRLFFRAEVHSPSGLRLARAKAVHWILEEI